VLAGMLAVKAEHPPIEPVRDSWTCVKLCRCDKRTSAVVHQNFSRVYFETHDTAKRIEYRYLVSASCEF